MADTPRLATIYARVSTRDQSERGYSLPQQIAACLALAQHQGCEVPESHIFEEDHTGSTLERPQLARLRALVASGPVTAVYVYGLDRLSRVLLHQLMLTDEFAECGVPLRVVTLPGQDDSPEGELSASMLGSINQFERRRILRRTKEGLIGRAKAGYPPGGRVPLGYRYMKHADKGGHYEIDETGATTVRYIFRLYVEEGLAIQAIAERLTREQVLTHQDHQGKAKVYGSGVWHPSVVSRILKNEAYIGRLTWGKHPRQKRTIPQIVEIPIPPIIDEETFAAAQAQRGENVQHARRNRQHEYLLSNGRLRCEHCGHTMSGAYQKHKNFRAYRCTRPRYLPGERCRGFVAADKIERHVWQAVERALLHPEVIAEEVARQQRAVVDDTTALRREQGRYEQQLDRCERDLRKWEHAYLNDVLTLEDFRDKKAEIDTRRRGVQEALSLIERQMQALAHAGEIAASLTTYCKRVAAKLQEFTLAEQQMAIEALNIRVIWHRDQEPEIIGSIPLCIDSHTL